MPSGGCFLPRSRDSFSLNLAARRSGNQKPTKRLLLPSRHSVVPIATKWVEVTRVPRSAVAIVGYPLWAKTARRGVSAATTERTQSSWLQGLTDLRFPLARAGHR
jgi:hypothetical protein